MVLEEIGPAQRREMRGEEGVHVLGFRSTCFPLPAYVSSRGSHNISEVPSLTYLGGATPPTHTHTQRRDSYVCGRNDSSFQIPDSSFPYMLLPGFFFISTGEKLVLKALFFLLLPLLLSPTLFIMAYTSRAFCQGRG